MTYARRYSALARETAEKTDRKRSLNGLRRTARVPEFPADFYEACQSFWFVRCFCRSNRADTPFLPALRSAISTIKGHRRGQAHEGAEQNISTVSGETHDINKVRDAASADGFAGYGMFQNLIVGGQNVHGMDATNDLSYMCLEAAMHVPLPQPSLSVRVWNGSPQDLLVKAAALTRLGTGLPAYYNDEVIIPSIMSRGLTLEDARDYCIIGCVEP
ncbi:MAG: pyruvate formate lyase family protein, partial [Christensenellaceae bacterium]